MDRLPDGITRTPERCDRVLRSTRQTSRPTFPEWWNWDLSFTSHAELRMEQRGVTEVEVRAMLEKATAFDPNVVEGQIHGPRPPSLEAVDRDRRTGC